MAEIKVMKCEIEKRGTAPNNIKHSQIFLSHVDVQLASCFCKCMLSIKPLIHSHASGIDMEMQKGCLPQACQFFLRPKSAIRFCFCQICSLSKPSELIFVPHAKFLSLLHFSSDI